MTKWPFSPLVALFSFAVGADIRAAEPRPNILVIVADDLGYGELGCYGGKDAPTPTLDTMAQSGMRFTSGYVTCPVCSPSRAALLTGRYQHRFGHENNIGQSWELEHGEFMGLPKSEKTLAERLKAVGYRTAAIGKWHLGVDAGFHPVQRGFEEFFGFLDGGRAYLSDDDPGNYYFKAVSPYKQVHFKEGERAPILRNMEPVQEKEYLTDAFTREAIRFVDKAGKDPFFIYLSYNAVHTPITPCARWYDKLAHIQNPIRRTLASMTAAMDEDIGKLRAHLQERGIDRNTLIIFTSDNGGSPSGNHSSEDAKPENYSLNTPFRGFKGQCYEGGIRIPFLIEWPGKIKAGPPCDATVSALDIVPTALAAAGAAPAEATDGVNLLPLLTGKDSSTPHDKLFWRFASFKAVRKGTFKLVKQQNKPDELYDLSVDPAESNDVSSQKESVHTELSAELAAWEKQLSPPLWKQNFPVNPDGKPRFPRQAK